MQPTVNDFIRVLFDPDDYINVCPTNWITSIHPVAKIPDYVQKVFFAINPIRPGMSRSDKAVSKLRNILVEMDQGILAAQHKTIVDSGLPFSTMVFSGGKSLHSIISLATPCTDRADYDSLVKRVFRALGGKAVVDTSCGNPSRQSRWPNGVRDNGNIQHLIYCKERIQRDVLEAWLTSKGIGQEEPKVPKVYERKAYKKGEHGRLSGFTLNFLSGDWVDGEWNITLFRSACDLFNHGYDEDEAMEMLEGVTGSLDSKDRSTIRSALKRTRE